jgi:hypothetical protein
MAHLATDERINRLVLSTKKSLDQQHKDETSVFLAISPSFLPSFLHITDYIKIIAFSFDLILHSIHRYAYCRIRDSWRLLSLLYWDHMRSLSLCTGDHVSIRTR